MLKKILIQHPLTWLVSAFVFLCLLFNIFIPVFETPDESGHYGYIKFFLTNNKLPQPPYPWESGGSLYHPPLYYLLIAPFLKYSLDGDYSQNVKVNNKWKESRFAAVNAFIHDKSETEFSWERKVFVFHLIRLFSTLFGVLTVMGTYFIASSIFKKKEPAIISAAIVAFNPQYVFHSSAVTNDLLATVLSTVVILILVTKIRYSFLDKPLFDLLLGIFVGSAVITKLNMLFLVPVVVIAYLLIYKKELIKVIKSGLIAFIGVMVAGGWYFARNIKLYGEPFGISAQTEMFSIFANKNTGIHLLNDVLLFFVYSFQTYWGVFGWYNIFLPLIYYMLIFSVTLFAFVVFTVYFFKNIRNLFKDKQLQQYFIIGLSTAVLWGSMLGTFLKYPVVSNGRFMFPTVATFAVILAFGLYKYFKIDIKKAYIVIMIGFLFNLAILNFVIIPKYY